jgi:hypothetical protein
MQDGQHSLLLTALLKALKPIARVLMKAGIGYREFAEISKCAFVDVATSDYGIRGRPTNISRVAVMTGLTRKEVKRIRNKISEGTDAQALRVIPPAEILDKWHSDPKYLDDNGRPVSLPLDGDNLSFASLVKQYGGDIPPGAMKTELRRVGAIEETDSGNLRVVKRFFRPVEKEDQLERALGQAIYGLGLNLNHNLGQSPEDSWVERIAYSSKIRTGDAGRVRRISQDRAADFVESINDLFSAYETIYSDEHSNEPATVVGVGVYYFEDPEGSSDRL